VGHPPAGSVKNVFVAGRLRCAPPACMGRGTAPGRRRSWSPACARSNAITAARPAAAICAIRAARRIRPPARSSAQLGSLRAALERLGHQVAMEARGRPGDPRRAPRLLVRARPRPNHHEVATRAPAARRLGDHPPPRQLERRAYHGARGQRRVLTQPREPPFPRCLPHGRSHRRALGGKRHANRGVRRSNAGHRAARERRERRRAGALSAGTGQRRLPVRALGHGTSMSRSRTAARSLGSNAARPRPAGPWPAVD
jgi:hypothetical protein